MLTDSLVNFLPYGSNLAITSAAVRSNIYDELGLGIGVTAPVAGTIIGNASVFGADLGVGRERPLLISAIGTTFAGSGTLTIAVQGAIDAGGGIPGPWQTFVQSPAYTVAQLVANGPANSGFIGRFDWPPEYPDGFNPRFISLLFTPSATFTAGTIAWSMVTMSTPTLNNKFAAANFAVKG
jgi:hypothetical protein